MKSVLISIRPEWCRKIISGEKTIEVRKTRPKLDLPFKCYIYCTSGHPYISVKGGNLDRDTVRTNTVGRCNGKVIGEFVCDRIIPGSWSYNLRTCSGELLASTLYGLKGCCLTDAEIIAYGQGNDKRGGHVFGWHISDLNLYRVPRELQEFRQVCPKDLRCESCAMYREHEGACGNEALRLLRPPQSWMYVEENSTIPVNDPVAP